MEWKTEFNIGIQVIDDQHKRIVDYINELEIILSQKDYHKQQVAKVLEDIIEYTQSHFSFEESLQEQAGYAYISAHKSVHQAFINKLSRYQQKFLDGTVIEKDLHKMLLRWLINHIQHDDTDYVEAVKHNMIEYIEEQEAKKGKGWFSRFFA